MALADVILEIADEMAQRASGWSGDVRNELEGYAKQLRRAVRAAGDQPPRVDRIPSVDAVAFMPPHVQHRHFIELAKEQMRAERGLAPKSPADSASDYEEREGPANRKAVSVYGDPSWEAGAPQAGSVDYDMPLGSFTEIAGRVYQLREEEGPGGAKTGAHALYYHPEQTARWQNAHTEPAGENKQKPTILLSRG